MKCTYNNDRVRNEGLLGIDRYSVPTFVFNVSGDGFASLCRYVQFVAHYKDFYVVQGQCGGTFSRSHWNHFILSAEHAEFYPDHKDRPEVKFAQNVISKGPDIGPGAVKKLLASMGRWGWVVFRHPDCPFMMVEVQPAAHRLPDQAGTISVKTTEVITDAQMSSAALLA